MAAAPAWGGACCLLGRQSVRVCLLCFQGWERATYPDRGWRGLSSREHPAWGCPGAGAQRAGRAGAGPPQAEAHGAEVP